MCLCACVCEDIWTYKGRVCFYTPFTVYVCAEGTCVQSAAVQTFCVCFVSLCTFACVQYVWHLQSDMPVCVLCRPMVLAAWGRDKNPLPLKTETSLTSVTVSTAALFPSYLFLLSSLYTRKAYLYLCVCLCVFQFVESATRTAQGWVTITLTHTWQTKRAKKTRSDTRYPSSARTTTSVSLPPRLQ